MTEPAAREILAMMKDHWNMYLSEPTVEMWMAFLVGLDAELATKAVAKLATSQRETPKIADVKETVSMLRRQAESRLPGLPQATKREKGTPEWVWVWSWARHSRTPRCLIPFPQQSPHVDPTEVMSMDEYASLREEWVTAGSPKAKHPIPLAVTR